MKDTPMPSTIDRQHTPVVIQIVGYKNSGKTTLIGALLQHWSTQGKKVAVIKHDAHEFQMDHAGTDTYAHTQAGAAAIAISSATRTAIIEQHSSTLEELISRFEVGYDLILVEGFKQADYPKIVIVADEQGISLVHELVQVKWVYNRYSSSISSNLKEITFIDAEKDGIITIIHELENYIEAQGEHQK
ncbi:putative molybdopterin-guanine dinucleotide biosynthesis adapter protein [Paenibacillus nuruki]|uniref:Putative molybdopterin-guanine dinucleotide biosynthesis adapter protein n=1 Tax=Paenibacillus nuruki TaxID=1886670 RepID=A0A1E3L296_9BACL|nr:molybdopterin-guanine dinucleotide biosynthesis protein B [Paenibacillus nuruki]ODP27919.1 putative molybdopterin-guanine dinucleotide biosynthesis adapter protein [Paenibacillus nuruki]